MADRKLTLFEVNLNDATFTANAKAVKGDDAALPDEEDGGTSDENGASDDDGGCAAKRAGTALLALAVLVVLAVAAGKLLGEESLDEELGDLADLDET